MLLKFTPIRLNISINKDPNDPLFEVPQLNDFSTIESKIKNLFWWFRKEEGWIDIVNPKQYGDKYVVVKYYDKSTEKISLMEDLSKWKLLIMCLQIAEKNKINEFKEVVEDGKVQFRITTNQEIFEDYYIWIYLSNSLIEEENGFVYTGHIFSVQKWRNSIKEVIKSFLADVYPDCSISLDYQTTKKKMQQFQEAVNKVIIKGKLKPSEISPDLISWNSNSDINIKMELMIKKWKESLSDKTQNAINQFRNHSKDILSKAIDWAPFDMGKKQVKAKFWKQEVWLEMTAEEIMCIVKDDKEIKADNYTYEWFKAECIAYFNQWKLISNDTTSKILSN